MDSRGTWSQLLAILAILAIFLISGPQFTYIIHSLPSPLPTSRNGEDSPPADSGRGLKLGQDPLAPGFMLNHFVEETFDGNYGVLTCFNHERQAFDGFPVNICTCSLPPMLGFLKYASLVRKEEVQT